MNTDLRKRILFFAENAGYCTPPGRLACAKNMALTEIEAEKLDLTVEWNLEDDNWLDFIGDCEPEWKWKKWFESGKYEVFSAHIENDQGDYIACLGGIILDSKDDNYKRVVECELYQEAIGELKK